MLVISHYWRFGVRGALDEEKASHGLFVLSSRRQSMEHRVRRKSVVLVFMAGRLDFGSSGYGLYWRMAILHTSIYIR